MKILSLKFTNLNSLKGSWHIDFTDDAFVYSGIFAIIGQTGAGKTTILDAICLAIYGQTPRIKQISAAQNELMSIGAGECMAQVDIKIDGKAYRFLWQQRRAGSKADGKLQAIRREISEITHANDDNGTILETKPSLCDKKAIEIMHMNFEQFTRSVMLAQGNFAAFLKADAGEKGEILEQITGTEIYAKIGIKAYEVSKQKHQELTALQDKLNDSQIMADDEYHALQTLISTDEQTLKNQQLLLSDIEQRIKRLEQQQAHEQKIQKLNEALQAHQQAFDSFQPQLCILENANKARELENPYQKLSQLRQQLAQLRTEHAQLSGVLQQVQIQVGQSLAQKNHAASLLASAQQDEQNSVAIFQQVRKLDEQLAKFQERHSQLVATQKQHQQDAHSIQQEISSLSTQKTQTQATLAQISTLTAWHSDDFGQSLGLLTAQEAELTRQMAQFSRLQTSTHDAWQNIQELQHHIEQKRQEYQENHSRLRDSQAQCQHLEQQFFAMSNLDEMSVDSIAHFGITLGQKINDYTVLNSVLEKLTHKHQEQHKLQTTIAQHQTQISELTKLLASTDEQIDTIRQNIQQQSNLLDSLEQNQQLQSELQLLKKHLHALQDGQPCPLCGATEHPYKVNTKSSQSTDDKTQDTIAQLNQQLGTLNDELQQATHQKIIGENNLANLQEQLITSKDQLGMVTQKITHSLSQATSLCQKLNVTDIAILHTNPEELLTHSLATAEQLGAELHTYQMLSPQITQALNTKNTLETQQTTIKQQGESLKNQIALANDSLTQQNAELTQLSSSIHQNLTQIMTALTKLGESTPALMDKSSLNVESLSNIHQQITVKLTQLTQKHDEYQHNLAQKQTLERTLDALVIHLDNQQTQLQNLEQTSQNTQAELLTIADEIADITQQRQEIFGDKVLDKEEQSLRQRIHHAHEALNGASDEYHCHQHSLTTTEDRLTALDAQSSAVTAELDQADTEFGAQLHAQGFTDEAHFLSSQLDNDQRMALHEQADAMRYAIKKTQDELHQEQQLLATLSSQIQDNQTLDELHTQKQTLQNDERTLLQTLGKNQQILINAKAERDKHKELAKQLSLKKQDLEIWAKLTDLIGSADGKKYRNFVQSLTLEFMLHHANKVLARMSERYILHHPQDNAKNLLEIHVIDTHQGNEERSTKNLSGGESFIISLALALGLSMMSSENTRIDSLFLDEGFGTLDEEILDVALSTLSALQEDGKMIGIISHVATLKERISTQIIVKKGAQGTSHLSGSGVHRIGK